MAEELTRGSSRAPTERITTLTPSSCRYHLVQHQQLLARQMEAQQQRCSRALLAAHLRTHARQVSFKLKPLANGRSASRSERLLEARASKQPPAAAGGGRRRQQRRGITNGTSDGGGDDVLLDAVECHVYLQANDALGNAAVDIVHHTQGAATDMVHHVVHEMPVDSGSSCFSCCSGRPADLDLTNFGPRPVFGAADDVSAALDSIGDAIGDAFRSAWQGMSTAGELAQGATEGAGRALSSLQSAGEAAVGGGLDIAVTIVQKAGGVAVDGVEAVASGVGDALGGAGEVLGEALGSVLEGAGEVVGEVLVGAVLGALEGE